MTRLQILKESDDWVAVDKPPGLLTIPDRSGKDLALRDLMQQQFGDIYVVHRLDRDTSGVILFARNALWHKKFSEDFEGRNIEKMYLGIVHGILPQKNLVIDQPIAEHPGKKGLMTVNRKGKESITEYEVVEELGKFSILRFRIRTGRTHQIRVHMQWAGYPIVCDPLYGDGQPIRLSSVKRNYKLSMQDEEKPILSRLGLHAHQLKFQYKDGVSVFVEAPLHRDMDALCKQLRKWTTAR